MPSVTVSFPSRLGFKGTEDLGRDLKAIFVLETGFSPNTSLQGQGRLFGRQVYVGLKNTYGTLMFGRQVNMTYPSILKADVMGPNIHGIGSLDGYLPNFRSDNAIAFIWGSLPMSRWVQRIASGAMPLPPAELPESIVRAKSPAMQRLVAK